MKYSVRRFKSLEIALKELEPFIRDGTHLQTGKPFRTFGDLRSRELLSNWLLCASMTAAAEGQFEFITDPTGGDGVIIDTSTDETWPTEHVMVANVESEAFKPIEVRILEQVGHKAARGETYGRGKSLLVFLNAAAGSWYPNRVARALPDPLHFDTVWVMGLQGVIEDAYVYGVCNLRPTGNSPTWRLTIAPDFRSWTVVRIQ